MPVTTGAVAEERAPGAGAGGAGAGGAGAGDGTEDPAASAGGGTKIQATAPVEFGGGPVAVLKQFLVLLRQGDDAGVEAAIVQLSQSRRWLAPVALLVGAVLMLFQGVKLLFANWRLTLIQLLPAMWIWLAMMDFKVHLLHGKQFHVLRGPVLIPLVLAIAGLTAASFFFNAVFAFAISKPGKIEIRPGFAEARRHLWVVLAWGFGIGVALAFSTTVVTRWGPWPFALALSIVIAVMMVCYLAVPARLIGIKSTYSKGDKLKASAIGGALGAVVCSPPYVLGRVGLLMLGVHYLFVPGIILLIIGITLTAGATSAVKSAKILG